MGEGESLMLSLSLSLFFISSPKIIGPGFSPRHSLSRRFSIYHHKLSSFGLDLVHLHKWWRKRPRSGDPWPNWRRRKSDNTYQGTTWQIKFKLDEVVNGMYKLRIALASATVAELQVRVNDRNTKNPPIFSSGQIGKDNAVARHGIHGLYWLFNMSVPNNILFRGDNTIYLTQSRGQTPWQNLMYDYIRLESPSSNNTPKIIATNM